MGYLLSSLGKLPIEDDVNLYIFVAGGNFQGGRYEILERNFAAIARQIGPNAVIAKGFEQNLWSIELCQKYFGKDWESVIHLGPGLLITDAHPDRLRDDSLRLFIPLKDAEKHFGDLETFFQSLTNFALHRDDSFLKRFQDKDEFEEGNISVKNLPKDVFGIGVNMDAFKRRYRHLRRKYPMAEPTILAAIAAAVTILADAPSALQTMRNIGVNLGLIESYKGQEEPEDTPSSPLYIITQGMAEELTDLSRQFNLRKDTWDQPEREAHRRRIAAKASELMLSGKPVLEAKLGTDEFNKLQAVFSQFR